MSNFLEFKKKIKKRNHQEFFACVIVFVAYMAIGFDKEGALAKIFCFEISLAAVFIGSYIFKKSYKYLNQLNDSKEGYVLALENEIKLLSNIKYWYVLPPMIGLLGLIIEDIVRVCFEGKNPVIDVIYLFLMIILGIGIIYINEVKGVKALKEELNKLSRIGINL